VREVHRGLSAAIEAGHTVEVSTGLFFDHAGTSDDGAVVGANFRPDHLAILPDQRGACSRAAGCGLSMNLALNTRIDCGDEYLPLPTMMF
jgi:hypothetical protein